MFLFLACLLLLQEMSKCSLAWASLLTAHPLYLNVSGKSELPVIILDGTIKSEPQYWPHWRTVLKRNIFSVWVFILTKKCIRGIKRRFCPYLFFFPVTVFFGGFFFFPLHRFFSHYSLALVGSVKSEKESVCNHTVLKLNLIFCCFYWFLELWGGKKTQCWKQVLLQGC